MITFKFRTVFKSDLPKTNELFYAGRMAYVIDLEEGEFAEGGTDIPTTTIRSKADVEAAAGGSSSAMQHTTLSTNDIVINKLTQILSYLRAGSRNKKKKKQLLSAMRGKDELVQQELISLRDSKQSKAKVSLIVF